MELTLCLKKASHGAGEGEGAPMDGSAGTEEAEEAAPTDAAAAEAEGLIFFPCYGGSHGSS